MILLICIIMMVTSWLLGEGSLFILYGKRKNGEFSPGDSLLMGYILCIGLAEAAHLGVLFLGRSFSACIKLYQTGLVVASAVCVMAGLLGHLFLCKKDKKKKKSPFLFTKAEIILALALFLMMAGQILYIGLGSFVYRGGDMTMETVKSFLYTDTVYAVNPMTGEPYALGMPMRLKVLCLPSMYGFLCGITKLSPEILIWKLMPILMLLGTYAAYATLGKYLFRKEKTKRLVFLLIVSVLIWAGDSMYGVDGFGLLHGGFRPEAVRAAILLPYTFGLLLRKKWRLLPLCILAEGCIVWTLYGMGTCFLITVGFVTVGILIKVHEKKETASVKEGRA